MESNSLSLVPVIQRSLNNNRTFAVERTKSLLKQLQAFNTLLWETFVVGI